MQLSKHIETLDDLIGVIEQDGPSHIVPMLRTLRGHIALAANKEANQIMLRELHSLRPELRLYLAGKQSQGAFTRNTVRSYLNYFRILLQKAENLGVTISPDVSALWSPIAAAVSREYGSRDIIRYAMAKGISPSEYSDEHLDSWCERMAKSGRHPVYIRARASAFRRRVLEAGLADQLPKLSPSKHKPNYCVPLEKFPEPLRSDAASVLEWKVAPFVRGRPARYRCRPVTVRGLKRLFCGIVGFEQAVLGRTPQTLNDLLCEEVVSKYVEWRLVERGVTPLTVLDQLRLIRPLAMHPLLKGHDFKWVGEIMSDLPAHSDNKVKESKQRKFVRFDDLTKVIHQLIRKANATTDIRKQAILIRDALLIEFLLTLAWRQRNIRECRLAPSSSGGNIFKEVIPPMSTMALPESVEKVWRLNPQAEFWQISFDADGTKSKRPVRALLPRQLIPLLERYIPLRRVLLRPGATDPGQLFLNDHGRRFTPAILGNRIAGITSRYAGKPINPHLFRDIHAEWWLAKGRSLELLATNLWHVDSSFTLRVYGRMFDESHGARALEDCLGETDLGNA